MVRIADIINNPDLVNEFADDAEQRAGKLLEDAGERAREDGEDIEPSETGEHGNGETADAEERQEETGETAEEHDAVEVDAVAEEKVEEKPMSAASQPQEQAAATSTATLEKIDEELKRLDAALEKVSIIAEKFAKVASSLKKVEEVAPGVSRVLEKLVEKVVEEKPAPPPPRPAPERVVIERIIPKPVPVHAPPLPPHVEKQVETAKMQGEVVREKAEELVEKAQQATSMEEIQEILAEMTEVKEELAGLRSQVGQLAVVANVDKRVMEALRPIMEQVSAALEKIAEAQRILAEKVEALKVQGVYIGRIKRVYPNGVVEYDLDPDAEIDMKIAKFITEDAGKALIQELHGTREDIRYIGSRIIGLLETIVLANMGVTQGIPRPPLPGPVQHVGYVYQPTPRPPEQVDMELDRLEKMLERIAGSPAAQQPQQSQIVHVPAPHAAAQTQQAQPVSQVQATQEPEAMLEEQVNVEDITPAEARIVQLPAEENNSLQELHSNQ